MTLPIPRPVAPRPVAPKPPREQPPAWVSLYPLREGYVLQVWEILALVAFWGWLLTLPFRG